MPALLFPNSGDPTGNGNGCSRPSLLFFLVGGAVLGLFRSSALCCLALSAIRSFPARIEAFSPFLPSLRFL